MRSAWIVDHFPNLVAVRLEGMRLENADELTSLSALTDLVINTPKETRRSLGFIPRLRDVKRLELTVVFEEDTVALDGCSALNRCILRQWPFRDFKRIPNLCVQDLVVVGGSIANPLGLCCNRLASITFANCRKLANLEGLSVSELEIGSCKGVDLHGLHAVNGLKNLSLIDHAHLHSFDFVLNCRQLEELTISATKVFAKDIGPLIESTSLLKLTIYNVPDKVITAVGLANTSLSVPNENVRVRKGQIEKVG